MSGGRELLNVRARGRCTDMLRLGDQLMDNSEHSDKRDGSPLTNSSGPFTNGPQLITPDDYPEWVPGEQYLSEASSRRFDGVAVRGFHYENLDVTLPPVRDYLVVAYHRGVADMRREFDGKWSRETLGPGDVTLLTRAVETRWTWREAIDVVHVHLTEDLVSAVSKQMYDRPAAEVLVRDELKADDDVVFRTSMQIASEASTTEAGSGLLLDSLSTQLAVHLLRHHAELKFREHHPQHGLPEGLLGLIRDYVHEHLHEPISLADLAGAVSLSQYHFARRFKEATGTTPHNYVMNARLDRARHLLVRARSMSLAEVSIACGFSDQSHMTKVFRTQLATTPGRFRNAND